MLAAISKRLNINVNDDELVEVTPKSIRIRKKLLTELGATQFILSGFLNY